MLVTALFLAGVRVESLFFFFQAEDGIRDVAVTGVQTCALPILVALDVETADRALGLFDALHDVVGMFKIGSQLFTAAGPGIVRQIVARGGRIFLDLKFHDIPNTVAAAGIEATRLGVSIFNVHASGGSEMMIRTAGAVAELVDR